MSRWDEWYVPPAASAPIDTVTRYLAYNPAANLIVSRQNGKSSVLEDITAARLAALGMSSHDIATALEWAAGVDEQVGGVSGPYATTCGVEVYLNVEPLPERHQSDRAPREAPDSLQ